MKTKKCVGWWWYRLFIFFFFLRVCVFEFFEFCLLEHWSINKTGIRWRILIEQRCTIIFFFFFFLFLWAQQWLKNLWEQKEIQGVLFCYSGIRGYLRLVNSINTQQNWKEWVFVASVISSSIVTYIKWLRHFPWTLGWTFFSLSYTSFFF